MGSGLGGLECGAILSKEGYKILILEKNKQIGGNLQTFVRDRNIFDTGIHYVGGLDEGQNLNRYFKFLGIADDLKLQKLDEKAFDYVSFDGNEQQYPHAQGYERFVDELLPYFPKERENLLHYTQKIKEVCKAFPLYFLENNTAGGLNATYMDISAKDFIASCTTDEKLQKVLAGTNLLYAGEGNKTPLYVHAMVINSYIDSAYRFKNGGSQIAKLLTKIIYQHGGKIIKHANINRINVSNGLIDFVETKKGRKYFAKQFISNIHPANTIAMIERGNFRNAYRKRIEGLQNSISVFILFLVIKPNSLKYFNCNYYHFIDQDVWNGPNYSDQNWPPNYAVFTGATIKENDYTETMTVMAYMDYKETVRWQGTYNIVSEEEDRGDEYQNFKRQKAEKLIDELEKKFPGIKSKIKSYYTSTPLTYRDYIGTYDGSLYGITKDYKHPIKSFISSKTKIPNLFFTGQNLNMHGVLGVTLSSIITCSQFLGHEYLMDKVRKS